MVLIVKTEVFGRGLFAEKDYDTEDIIWSEQATIVVHGSLFQCKDMERLCVNEREMRHFRTFLKTPLNLPLIPDAMIMLRNCFGMPKSNDKFFFPTIGLVNHNCQPNAQVDIGDGDEGVMKCVRKIQKGEIRFGSFLFHSDPQENKSLLTICTTLGAHNQNTLHSKNITWWNVTNKKDIFIISTRYFGIK